MRRSLGTAKFLSFFRWRMNQIHPGAVMPSRRKWSRALLLCSFIAYAACLALPAFWTGKDATQAVDGANALVFGPIALIQGHMTWLANPLLWASWIQRYRGKAQQAAVFASLSMLIALTFFLHEPISTDFGRFTGPVPSFTFRIGSGYYTWLVSIGLAGLSALAYGWRRRIVAT